MHIYIYIEGQTYVYIYIYVCVYTQAYARKAHGALGTRVAPGARVKRAVHRSTDPVDVRTSN